MSELYLTLYDMTNILVYMVTAFIVIAIAVKIVNEFIVPGRPIVLRKTVMI